MHSRASNLAYGVCLPLALLAASSHALPQGAPRPGPDMTSGLGDGPSPVPSAATPPHHVQTTDAVHKLLGLLAASSTTDPFKPVATDAPPSQIASRGPHPVPTLGIQQDGALQTNKFYANLFLGSQNNSVWTDPYSVAWSRGGGAAGSWGLAVSHIDAAQRAYGAPNPNITGSPVSDVINPVGIESVILSAAELGPDTTLTTDGLGLFSVNANLAPGGGSSSSVRFPLAQGMGFVTAQYTALTPLLESGVGFASVCGPDSPADGVFRYTLTTQDQVQWLLYAFPSNSGPDPGFKLANGSVTGPTEPWSGFLQLAKNPGGAAGLSLYDDASGMWAAGGNVTGAVSGSVGNYTFTWLVDGVADKGGEKLLMWALPHHLQSFDALTAGNVRNMTLATTTSGNATAVTGMLWTLSEPALPTDMGFAPWSPAMGSVASVSAAGQAAIQQVVAADAGQDIDAQVNVNSFYYAGKALSKFASIVWVLQNYAGSKDLAAATLKTLEASFATFTDNKNQFPLVYDTTWKGAVSAAWNDSGADFGNSFYNDHHFHYGYFLHAAAVVGSMDAAWLAANKDYINTMARDVANPSAEDPYFPVFRSFDWYHAHSWAKGLFDSADGKDEESSSEDVMFAYGLKMWGQTVGDPSMEARGNLMLSVLARGLQNYFLMESNNTVQPPNFIGNKVTGILFENKIDHTTYFGGNLEYVQGIHMLPLVPASTLSRTQAFVQQEWGVYFADNATDPASAVVGGWKGVLYANLAIIDPVTSFRFFSQPNFDSSWLDGGASLTWYLAFAAALGGA